MKIVRVTENLAKRYKGEIAELIWSTGPVSYEYQFGSRDFFNRVVEASWSVAGTLFGWDGTHLALDGDDVVGILVSFPGPEFDERKVAMAGVSGIMLESGHAQESEILGLIERAEHARWLNPELRSRSYYVHAIAVKPESRGQQIGFRLLEQAKKLGRDLDCMRIELDVLCDNRAVAFYRSQGLSVLAETTAPKTSAYGIPPEFRMGMMLTDGGTTL